MSAAQAWADALTAAHPEVTAVGYFGSYARGDAGVGSDLDIVVLLRASDLPFERRANAWPAESLPVPADVIAYTLAEWGRLPRTSPRFARVLREETRWLVGAPSPSPPSPSLRAAARERGA